MKDDWNLRNVRRFPIPELAAMCCGIPIEYAEQAILECIEEEKTFIEKDIYCHPLIPELHGMCIYLHDAIDEKLLRIYVGPNTTSLPTDRRSTIRNLKEFIVQKNPDLIIPPLFTEAEAGLKKVLDTEASESLYRKLTAEKEARKQLEAELVETQAKLKKLETDKKNLATRERENFQKQVYFLSCIGTGEIKGAPFASKKQLFKAVEKAARKSEKRIEGVSEESLRKAYKAGCRLRQ